MARISRKCLNEKYYHIMVQGINKEYIFKWKTQKSKFKNLIFEKAKLNNVVIISYCIMDNHTHLLLKTEKISQVSKMMQQINTSYGKYYNKVKNRVGYVFRDRYRAEPIFNQTHLENCIRYIHENPVKAYIVSKCEDYEFSSYNDYKNGKIDEGIVNEVFGNKINYLEKISGKVEEYNFIDSSNEFGKQKLEKFEEVCQEYSQVDFSKAKNVYKVSNELKKRCGALNVQIIEFIGLKRATYYNIMKSQRNLDF